MTDEKKQTRKYERHFDRVTVKPDALARVDEWLAIMRERCKGIRVTRADLVNWLILRHQPELSAEDQAELQRAFFDDELLGAWVLQSLKERRSKGESVTYFDVLAEATKGRMQKNAKPRQKKPAPKVPGDVVPPAQSEGPSGPKV